jgi:hypothetical protein
MLHLYYLLEHQIQTADPILLTAGGFALATVVGLRLLWGEPKYRGDSGNRRIELQKKLKVKTHER